MKLKRFLALALSLSLSLSLAACGSNDADGDNSPATSSDGSYTEMANAYTQTLAGIDKDTVLFTVNGQDVTAEYYLYWLSYDCYYWDYMNYYYYGANLDFTESASDDQTVAEYLRDDAKNFTVYYLMIEQQAAANNCGLTDAQRADWAQQKADYIEEYGQEAFDLLMSQWGVTTEVFDTLNTYSYLYENLQDVLIGEPSAEDLATYIEENEIYAAKHILILTAVEDEEGAVTLSTGGAITNEDGSEYTGTADEYNADALARIQDIAAQLSSSDNALELFDELMNEHSEDSGLASYPDGYTYTTGTMVTGFEDGVKELEYNEIGTIVESDYGYHIILRLEPDVSADYADAKLDAMLEQWMEEAEVVTTDAFTSIDSGSVYENYLTYQAALVSTDEDSTDSE